MLESRYIRRHIREIAAGLLMVTAAAIIYLQVIDFGLVAHDDTVNYDYFLMSLNRHGFFHTLITPPEHFSYWVPVTYLSYITDFLLWGNNPGRHHLNSLFYHIINGLLLFALLKKMTGKTWPAAFVALLLIVHPLNVEAVAYLASRSVLISTLFLLLALLSYVDYVKTPGPGRYLLTLLWFSLGMMAKPSVIHLPLTLLILDYWPLDRVSRPTTVDKAAGFAAEMTWPGLFKEKIPFFLTAGIYIIGNTYYLKTHYITSDYFQAYVIPNISSTLREMIGAPRAATILILQIPYAAISFLGYLWKTIWPTHLSWYIPTRSGNPFTGTETIGALLLLIAITGLTAKYRKQAPYLPAGWLWFMITLTPSVLNNTLLQNFIRDHYAYFSMVGLFLMAVWEGETLPTGYPYKRPALALVAALIIIAFVSMSWRQTGYWKNPLTLYGHALSIEPDSPYLHNNAGKVLYEGGRTEEAIFHFERALQAMPDSPGILTNLGTAWYARGAVDKAETCLRKALAINPQEIAAGYKLASIYRAAGDYENAATVYKTLLARRPEFSADICYDLACVYALLNQPEASVAWLRQSIANGFKRMESITTNPDLNNIRETEYYQSIVRNQSP